MITAFIYLRSHLCVTCDTSLTRTSSLPGAARVITSCDLGVAISARMPGTPRVVVDTAMLRRARRNHGKQEYCCIADRGGSRLHRSVDAADHGFQPAGRDGE